MPVDSDHTIGTIIPAAAVAMGAKLLKTFYPDKKLPDSPDLYSADPDDLKEMVEMIRRIEKAKGYFLSGYYPAEEKLLCMQENQSFQTKLYPKGQQLQLRCYCKRPGTGIYPEHMDFVIGSTAKVEIPEDYYYKINDLRMA